VKASETPSSRLDDVAQVAEAELEWLVGCQSCQIPRAEGQAIRGRAEKVCLGGDVYRIGIDAKVSERILERGARRSRHTDRHGYSGVCTLSPPFPSSLPLCLLPLSVALVRRVIFLLFLPALLLVSLRRPGHRPT